MILSRFRWSSAIRISLRSGTEARTASANSSRNGRGPSSTKAWVASSRKPSKWYSWSHIRAFSMKNARTISDPSPPRLIAGPQLVMRSGRT